MRLLLVVLGSLSFGCTSGESLPPVVPPDSPPVIDDDVDNDGSPRGVDCNDENDTVAPGKPELCDDLDNNCNQITDENSASFTDAAGVRDVSDQFTGTAGAPAPITFSTAGTLKLCGASTYFATITVQQDLTINGLGSTMTILDGGNANRMVITEQAGKETTITNLRLQNGRAPNNGAGGAIRCANSGTLNISDVVIANNISTNRGGGLGVDNCVSTLNRVTFDQNSAQNGSGGALNALGGSATLTNVTFTQNSASVGGAIASTSGAALTLIDSSVTDNSSISNQGGGAFISDASITCNSSTFHRNSGNGIVISGTSTLQSTLCNYGNVANTNNTPSDLLPAQSGPPATGVAKNDATTFTCSNTLCNPATPN